MFDLETLNLNELKQLQKDVTAAIEQFKDRERRKALAEVEAFARERGLTVADLSEISLKRNRKPAAPKYANPAD
ncbi:H-NS histone family protein, partial [Pararhodobacter sp.]|uniref:H-NS histone family protein n=1 Tax=Pararhodobacter sp. TaxID=2127056 RepID=UPI002FDD1D59